MSRKEYDVVFSIGDLDDQALGYLLDCLLMIDIHYLRKYPNLPLVYGSGVTYEHDGKKDDPFRCVLRCLDVGTADCEDLACWRAAELRVKFGIHASPCFVRKMREDGTELIHIFVRLPGQNNFEDPSKILGMR